MRRLRRSRMTCVAISDMNPFARVPIDKIPVDGNGLNPLLQDPGLAFHPPTLYIGYVGLSVAFSFAVGALVTRDVGPAFARSNGVVYILPELSPARDMFGGHAVPAVSR